MSTGIYMRVMRDGRAENVDLAEMTEAEICREFESETAKAARWIFALAQMVGGGNTRIASLEIALDRLLNEATNVRAGACHAPLDEAIDAARFVRGPR